MADNVQWLKFKVGMFDGNSFKKIKRVKIGGVPYRDKLTAVWFELLDLAGKSNANGYLIDNNEMPYHSFEDIAIMIDRDEKEVELCMQFFISEKMVEIIDDIYCLTNFAKYQNQDGLERIREQKRLAQAKWRERKKQGLIGFVDKNTSTVDSTDNLLSNSISNSYSNSISKVEEKKDRHNYKEIIDIYHQLCPSFPKCKTLSDKRKKQIKARLDTYSLEQIKEVFTNAENSDFLKGKVNGFKADFDWLMNDNNFAKTLEGKYNHTLTSPKSINNQQTKYNVTKSGTIDLSPKFIN